MKKYFLTTALMGTFIAPAFGADAKITEASTCTVDVLGVHENDAIANTIATWTLNEYECPAGQYLVSELDGTIGCTMCPTGSYCPGGKYTIEDDNKGTELCPSGYEFSDAGAKSNAQCYTTCTVATANIAHATEVSGNDYFGTGVDTCGATACEEGYHVNGGGVSLVEKDPLVPISLTAEGVDYGYISADGSSKYKDTNYNITSNNTWATEFAEGIVYGKASCQPKADPVYEWLMNNLESEMASGKTFEEIETELATIGGKAKAEAVIGFLEAMMGGGEGMSEEEIFESLAKFFVTFSESSDKNYATDSTGQYCYCQMDGFMPTGGTKAIVTSAPWVFSDVDGSADGCAGSCADNCASLLRNDGVSNLAFRGAVVGSLGAVSAGGTCAANTINIKWDPANGNAATENQCTYEGAITLPTPDPVKPGYVFTGWKLKTEN